jgi:hypothetical protein
MKSVSITKALLAQVEVEYAKLDQIRNLIFQAELALLGGDLRHLNASDQMLRNGYH